MIVASCLRLLSHVRAKQLAAEKDFTLKLALGVQLGDKATFYLKECLQLHQHRFKLSSLHSHFKLYPLKVEVGYIILGRQRQGHHERAARSILRAGGRRKVVALG